jgi:hypothetical protein
MADPTTPTQEHKKIGDELDAVYIEAVNAAAYAKGHLMHRHGNPNEAYEVLYAAFVTLFMYTSTTREMTKGDKYKDLINSVERWSNKEPRNHHIRSLIREGLSLFKEYQAAAIQSGAVVIRRE